MSDVDERTDIGFGADIEEVKLYTMRDLNQYTAATIEEINRSGKPGVITRRGRFVAVIYPLAHQPIEAHAIAQALTSTGVQNQLTGKSRIDGVLTALEAAARLETPPDVSNADRELNRGRGDDWY